MQHTIADKVFFNGVGLHSGVETKLVVEPADINTGIVFIRSDIQDFAPIPANYANVVDTRNCTCLGDKNGQIISTIEHLMAALSALKIDNALVKVNAPEMPILDGGALLFYNELKKVGLIEQSAPRHVLKVLQKVEFKDDKGNYVLLEPDDNFSIHFIIDFPSPVVGHQEFNNVIDDDIFISQIAPCRTFCEKSQIDYLRSIGLIKGGSLDNAVVLDGDKILNPDGFRVNNECVNHKVLDAIGDMATSGLPVKGKLTAFHSGHFHNNQILQTLFANSSNYIIEEE